MSEKLIIRPQVYWDLDEIAAYIRKDNPPAALRFLENAETTFDALAGMPGIGSAYVVRRAKFKDLRCFPVKGFKKYLVFYERDEAAIEIVRVLHGARNLTPILRRST
jgi:toxin ParE1/3/4